jgi:hypothetical protein
MRYRSSNKIKGGKLLSTSRVSKIIRSQIKNGNIRTKKYVSKENDRLDVLAGKLYGDSAYWWVIAICSDIGWGMQLPPNTIIKYPVDITKVLEYV